MSVFQMDVVRRELYSDPYQYREPVLPIPEPEFRLSDSPKVLVFVVVFGCMVSSPSVLLNTGLWTRSSVGLSFQ